MKHIPRGQSLFEVIIALALFSLLASALITMSLGGLTGLNLASESAQAEALAQESIEAARSIRDGAWNETMSGSVGAVISGSQWTLAASGTTTIGNYKRGMYIDDVCRTPAGAIASCPPVGGNYTDPHSRRVKVIVDWQTRPNVTNSVKKVSYITNWDSRDWNQMDWSCGPTQATWSVSNPLANSAYSSQSPVDSLERNTIGEVKLAQTVTGGSWTTHVQGSSLTTRQLNGISSVAANNVWVVGNSGTILRYNGSTWSTVSSPVSNDLNDVFMVSASDGWAVGASGKILHWNGTAWSQAIDTGGQTWRAVYMSSPGNGFVVGRSGIIYRYTGGDPGSGGNITQWNSVTSPVSNALNGLYIFSSGTDGWAVGDAGQIIRWNGTSWSAFQDTGTNDLQNIYMLSPCDGWAVSSVGLVYRWNGVTWSQSIDTGNETWSAVHTLITNDAWAVGNGGKIERWNGTSWVAASSPISSTINAIQLITSTTGWAVGVQGVILQLSGGTQSQQTTGTLVSSAFNMGDTSPVHVLEFTGVLPACSPACTIRIQVRTAPNAGGSPGVWTSWYGAGGVGTYFTVQPGTIIPLALNGNQWLQYQVLLNGSTSGTPILQDIKINYK